MFLINKSFYIEDLLALYFTYVMWGHMRETWDLECLCPHHEYNSFTKNCLLGFHLSISCMRVYHAYIQEIGVKHTQGRYIVTLVKQVNEKETYRNWSNSTGNKLRNRCAWHCALVPVLYFMNSGCVLECRDSPTSQVTIWSLHPSPAFPTIIMP